MKNVFKYFLPIFILMGCREDCVEVRFQYGYSIQVDPKEFTKNNDGCLVFSTGQVFCDVVEVKECK